MYCVCPQKPDRDEWGSGLDAMQVAMALEKSVNQSLLDLHEVAGGHKDAQVRGCCLTLTFTAHRGCDCAHALVYRVIIPSIFVELPQHFMTLSMRRWCVFLRKNDLFCLKRK